MPRPTTAIVFSRFDRRGTDSRQGAKPRVDTTVLYESKKRRPACRIQMTMETMYRGEFPMATNRTTIDEKLSLAPSFSRTSCLPRCIGKEDVFVSYAIFIAGRHLISCRFVKSSSVVSERSGLCVASLLFRQSHGRFIDSARPEPKHQGRQHHAEFFVAHPFVGTPRQPGARYRHARHDSTPAEQRSRSQFDKVAIGKKFIVVFPRHRRNRSCRMDGIFPGTRTWNSFPR